MDSREGKELRSTGELNDEMIAKMHSRRVSFADTTAVANQIFVGGSSLAAILLCSSTTIFAQDVMRAYLSAGNPALPPPPLLPPQFMATPMLPVLPALYPTSGSPPGTIFPISEFVH